MFGYLPHRLCSWFVWIPNLQIGGEFRRRMLRMVNAHCSTSNPTQFHGGPNLGVGFWHDSVPLALFGLLPVRGVCHRLHDEARIQLPRCNKRWWPAHYRALGRPSRIPVRSIVSSEADNSWRIPATPRGRHIFEPCGIQRCRCIYYWWNFSPRREAWRDAWVLK